MPTIYANSNDGRLSTTYLSTFSAARGATAAFSVTTNTTAGTGPGVSRAATRGGGSSFQVQRTFFKFDTSGITNTVSSATFKFKTNLNISDDDKNLILVSSDAFTNSGDLQASDIDNLDFSTPYSSEIDMNGTSINDVISVTLNSDALSAMQSESSFIIAMINHPFDFSNSAPSSNGLFTSNINYADNTDNANKPQIEYTEGAAASGPDNVAFVNTVAAASIATVNKVAYSSIETINTVS